MTCDIPQSGYEQCTRQEQNGALDRLRQAAARLPFDMTGSDRLGIHTLVALVIGNMIGAGVFTTSGLALGELGSPLAVLLAWVIAGGVALTGALSYGALARLMPGSGGEYYFLSRALHPLAGFVAGWVSLWAGFTAAIAFAALTLEAYLLPASAPAWLPEKAVASGVILLAALAHGLQVRHGAAVQNAAVLCKLVLLAAFLAFALFATTPGEWAGLAAWRASEGTAFRPVAFAMTLMWISFSYSGFNASVYVAGEAGDPRRRVGRAMIIGTLLCTAIYLLLNGILLFAPDPAAITGVEAVAAAAAQALGGARLELAMRAIIVLALFTSISAMIMCGPRVYAQMAEDGLMPARLRFSRAAPGAAVAAQALLAVAVVWLSGLRELLSYLGLTLGLSSAATVAVLFLLVRRGQVDPASIPGYPLVPALYVVCTLLFAALAALASPIEMLAALLTVVSAILAYGLARRHR
jgi:APA family basic amino acid/polyamine antiporter